MKIKIMILLLLIFNYAFNACAESEKEINYWDIVLKEAIISELKDLKLATEEDLLIFKEYGKDKKNGEFIYKLNLEAYQNKEMFSFLKGDFNKNGKEDVALACRDILSGTSYLVILEMDANKFRLIKYFPFKAKVFYIADGNKYIDILFQAGTDWMEQVYWNGSDYIIKKRDDVYGP